MKRTNLFLKVEVEHGAEEDPARLAREICRQLQKLYAVRTAEVASITTSDD
ncbi:MAG: hypothetical protein ACKV22_35395 [Bryobacteraceae bacterium]